MSDAMVGSQGRSLPGDDIWSSVARSPTVLEGRASEAEGERVGRLLGVKGGLREVAKQRLCRQLQGQQHRGPEGEAGGRNRGGCRGSKGNLEVRACALGGRWDWEDGENRTGQAPKEPPFQARAVGLGMRKGGFPGEAAPPSGLAGFYTLPASAEEPGNTGVRWR